MITDIEFGRELAASASKVRICTDAERNEYGETAAFPTGPVCHAWSIYPAKNGLFRSLAVDLDNKTGTAEADSRSLVEALGSLPAVTCASGPTGGRHVFLRFQVPQPTEVVSFLKKKWSYPSLDPSCMTPQITIRPPLAPHRLQGRSEPLDGAEEALARLQRGISPAEVRDLLIANGGAPWKVEVGVANGMDPHDAYERLSESARQKLSEGTDGDRSSLYWSIMLSAVRAGLDFRDVENLLVQLPGGQKYQQKLMKGPIATERLYGEWLKAQSLATVDRSAQEIQQWTAVAQSFDWKGKAGTTDMVVIQVLALKANLAQSTTFTASTRQIAEDAGIHRETVGNSLKRLIEIGLITSQSDGYGRSPIIQLVRETDHLEHYSYGGVLISGRDSVHNLFSYEGIGKTAGLVYGALNVNTPNSVAELMEATSKARMTVYDALKRLQEYGLVIKRDGGYCRTEASLDQIQKELNVPNYRERLELTHELQREGYNQYRNRKG